MKIEREGLLLAEVEQWRLALGDEVSASLAATKRIRQLERELARKDKALAEAAALLILKKKWGISGRARTTTPTRGTTADTQRGPFRSSPIVLVAGAAVPSCARRARSFFGPHVGRSLRSSSSAATIASGVALG